MTESGTQAIRRAGAVLRAIARFGPSGARLIDLSRTVGLARPTTHRIVQGLIAEMMVVQNARTKRYQLGPLIFELGLATTQRSTLPEVCRPAGSYGLRLSSSTPALPRPMWSRHSAPNSPAVLQRVSFSASERRTAGERRPASGTAGPRRY